MKTRVSLKYFVIECRFNNAFSTIDLDSVRDGAYVINLDDKKMTIKMYTAVKIQMHILIRLELSIFLKKY